MSAPKVILVTGANKGIGYAIVRNLALKYSATSNSQPLTIILTARDQNRGQTSLNELENELKPKKILKHDGGIIDLKFIQLDLLDENSIKKTEETISKDCNGLDILINNAGMAFKGDSFDINVVRTTFATNFYGTLNVSNHLFPLIRPNGRLINISSGVGRLSIISNKWKKEFSKEDLDIDGLIELMKKYENAVEKGTYQNEGWPQQGNFSYSYGMSKLGLTVMTNIFARRADKEGKGVLVFSCCPGWVRTDMAGPNAVKSPDQGAETPVFLAVNDDVVPKAP
ncbi:6074_t:CDS:2 [Diversispora eburnea]|uniref:6074_t:CDS:1 n=1 Tax=Diversispora eburnea TaxID=1213867 RepID=A0A9N8V2P2_9GLOM|nr:6074_t:CDS:2 [Diversispora eburnea]